MNNIFCLFNTYNMLQKIESTKKDQIEFVSEHTFSRCESLGPGYLVPRRNEPGFVQRKIQEKLHFSAGSVLKYF